MAFAGLKHWDDREGSEKKQWLLGQTHILSHCVTHGTFTSRSEGAWTIKWFWTQDAENKGRDALLAAQNTVQQVLILA